jgi:hypothetical protein
MMVRRSVFSVIGPFDVRLGAGTPACSAEDLDFIYRGLKRGLVVRYSPAPHVLHAHGRRSAATEAELSKGYLAGRGAFYAKHALRGDWNALKQLRWEIRGLGTLPKADSRRQALKALLSGGIGYILGR